MTDDRPARVRRPTSRRPEASALDRRGFLAGVAALPLAARAAEEAAEGAVEGGAWPAVAPTPRLVGPDQVALVDDANSAPGGGGFVECLFAFDEALAGRPVRGAEGRDDAARLVARLWAQGAAAGHRGDLYDNRDEGHSALDPGAWPQLGFVRYGAGAREAELHRGPNLSVRFNAPTIGNSSTAVTGGPLWRSLPRLALTTPGGPDRLSALYGTNHLYVYPAHRDLGGDGGDLLPALTPYLVASLGSSGSDLPFVRALLGGLAAFRPETKAFLAERGLIAPVLQLALRRAAKQVRSEEAYMSEAAHPPAFARDSVDATRLAAFANALGPGTAPPLARLAAAEEPADPGAAFADGLGEILFDTPFAAARLARGLAARRRYLLSAHPSSDPNGRPLTFEWRVLRAAPGQVAVTPLRGGERARVEVGWGSGRVDLALFAHNGIHVSPPAFFSVLFPPAEARTYGPDGRILSIDHAGPAREGRYADPLLWPRRDWRDDFDYDAEGRLLGWTRRRGAAETRFTAEGSRVERTDAAGRPVLSSVVAYPVRRSGEGFSVEETPTGARLRHDYRGPSDRAGVASRVD